MTLMLGQNCGTPCDPCCACGAFCSNSYCGCNMLWVGTYSGSLDGTLCTGCSADIDIAVAFMVFLGSTAASDWNSSRPSWTSHDAKAGTRVSTWSTDGSSMGTQVPFCSFAGDVRAHVITTYLGTDDKWRMVFTADVIASGYIGAIAGEKEFDSSGSPMDCGTPGEGSPTFSLAVPLTRYDYSGTPNLTCYPPTSVLVEGNPP